MDRGCEIQKKSGRRLENELYIYIYIYPALWAPGGLEVITPTYSVRYSPVRFGRWAVSFLSGRLGVSGVRSGFAPGQLGESLRSGVRRSKAFTDTETTGPLIPLVDVKPSTTYIYIYIS